MGMRIRHAILILGHPCLNNCSASNSPDLILNLITVPWFVSFFTLDCLLYRIGIRQRTIVLQPGLGKASA
jgi:hypothetical protein